MDIWDMRRQINDANQTLRNADTVATDIAPLLKGRLRKCNASDLVALKKELKDFNMHTYNWKD